MPERSVTIVHLSDLQFGKFHRFPEDEDPTNTFDTLQKRLSADFDYLRREHGVKPDLLVVTGDLAEWGRKSELEKVFAFVVGAAEALELPRSRIAVIPGNHDVDRKACQSYFFDCESREIAPVRPYPAKWIHYKTFFAELYEDVPDVTFTDGQPWTLFEYPELRTVIAGINSTWMESHLDGDHYGWIGEEQLRWFESRLRQHRDDGWLRIAALHHNVRRGPSNDDENLRDANTFNSIIGGCVNLVLHGHTHDGKADVLRKNVPIYSTGSAAVAAGQRPPEVPNQYQMLKIVRDGVHRWARAWRADERKFIGDNRASEKGDDWRTFDPFDFSDATALLDKEAYLEMLSRPPLSEFEFHNALRTDDLLTRIDRVCHVRHPNAAATQLFRNQSDPLPYLSLAVRDGVVTTQYPIGAAEAGITPELIHAFAATIHARYRRHDQSVGSLIVFGGDEIPSDDLHRDARRLGITLQSWVEFQGLIDFSAYVEAQRRQLESDPRYESRLYVPQRIRYSTPDGECDHDDALEALLDMMTEREGRFVVVLGEFGTGKSFLQRQLALRLAALPRPQPILIEMRTLEKAHDFDELIAQHLVRHRFAVPNLPAFRYMLEHGRLALLFDGFDELAMRVSYDGAADHLQTLVQASAGQAKIVVTSRTEYFESDQQVRMALAEKLDVVGGRRIVRLLRFDRPRIFHFLTKQLGNEDAAQRRMKLFDDIEDLSGLSENPRMLTFIASLGEEQLVKAKSREGKATRSSVYRTLIDVWLAFEEKRLTPRGAAPPLSVDERWDAVVVLARHMWAKPEASVKLSELSKHIADAVGKLPRIDATSATHQVGSGTLLVRDAEGNFSFVHRSILEWLVAIDAAADIREGRAPNALMVRDISPLIAAFIEEEVDADALRAWMKHTMRDEPRDSVLARNALTFYTMTALTGDAVIADLQLRGADLRGRDFSRQFMRDAELEGANLDDARFVATDLKGANLRYARLRSADLTEADLSGADLSSADLTYARLRGANLHGATLTGARLYRADLVAARIDHDAIRFADTFGAALPDALVRPVFDDGAYGHSLAFSPAGDLVIVVDRTRIQVWDVRTSRALAPCLAPLDCNLVTVGWVAGGQQIAAGCDAGQVLLWDLASTSPKWRSAVGSAQVLALREVGNALICVTTISVHFLARETGEVLDQFSLGNVALAASISHRPSASLLVAFSDGTLADVVGGKADPWPTRVPPGFIPPTLVISADARLAVVATTSKLHVLRRERVDTHPWEGRSAYSQAISPDALLTAICSNDRLVIHNTNKGETQTVVQFGASRAAISNDNKLVAVLAWNGIAIVDVAKLLAVQQISGVRDELFAFAMPTEDSIHYMGSPGVTRLLELSSGRIVEPESPILYDQVSYSPNALIFFKRGRRTLVMSSDMTQARRLDVGIEVWGTTMAVDREGWIAIAEEKRVVIRPPSGRKRQVELRGVSSLEFTPEGDLLLAANDSLKIYAINPRDGRVIREQRLTLPILDLCAGAGGRIACAHPGKVSLLKATDFSLTAEVFVDADRMKFSPSGNILAIVDKSGLMIRDLRSSLSHRASPSSHRYAFIAFSASGRRVACASKGGAIDVYDVESLRLVISAGIVEKAWVSYRSDGRFKSSGDLGGRFGHAINLVRFEAGEIDNWLESPLRVPEGVPLLD